MSFVNFKNKAEVYQQVLSMTGVLASLVIVILSFLLCLFEGLSLTVVWTSLGFHVTYQILYWNKRVKASAKGFEIESEQKKAS